MSTIDRRADPTVTIQANPIFWFFVMTVRARASAYKKTCPAKLVNMPAHRSDKGANLHSSGDMRPDKYAAALEMFPAAPCFKLGSEIPSSKG
jgi:hypothetical protein